MILSLVVNSTFETRHGGHLGRKNVHPRNYFCRDANLWRFTIWRSTHFFSLPPPNPQREWLRTLHDVMHEVHTIKIHDHQFAAGIIFVVWLNKCKNAPETVLWVRKIHILRTKWATSQTKAQKRSKDDFIREIWWPIRETRRSAPCPGELACMLLHFLFVWAQTLQDGRTLYSKKSYFFSILTVFGRKVTSQDWQ